MSAELPRLFLARHGDTAWTDSHQRTGRTDLPLNERGEERARLIGKQLQRFAFARVFTSPLQRASKTCALAGYGAVAEVEPDLVEWDYGRFEAKLTKQILKDRPGWELFSDGCPDGDVLAFSSGHVIRMIAARWLGLPPSAGRFFFCRPASVGVLAFEHGKRDEPIVALWNYVRQQD